MQDLLDLIFADDPDGLLNVKPKASAVSVDDRITMEVREINAFYEKYNREPCKSSDDISEFRLAKRLETLRSGKLVDVQAVYDADVHHLITEPKVEEEKAPESIDDIFSSPEFSAMGGGDNGLFDLRPALKQDIDREEADFVARRRPCKEFDKYKPMFTKVQRELGSGKRSLIKAELSHLKAGGFYTYNGVLFYVESIDITQKTGVTETGKHIYKNGRTRCIFENGTEAALLMRSVEKLLYLNGKTVTENNEEVAKRIEKSLGGITDEDESTGFIYVCSSKSKDPKISSIKNLFKIGYSTTPVEDRIKNAENEPTYLMAPIKLETSWQCYNMNPQKFEQLIHNFFGKSCLNVDVYDNEGKRHIPQEWFIAPLPIIIKAVAMIVSGDVVGNYYDPSQEAIVKRAAGSNNRPQGRSSAFKSRDIDSSVSMKALCVRQPWASLICAGIKDVENRTWTTKEVPGRILIVASNKPVPKDFLYYESEECQKAIVKAIKQRHVPNFDRMPLGAAIGYCDITAFKETTNSIWDGGDDQIKWVIKNAYVFDQPIYNVKCALRLYDLEGIDPNNLPKAHKVDLRKLGG